MSDEIIKLLDHLGEKFGIAIDWSSNNIMPYLQGLMDRYINYEVITSIVWIVFGLSLIIGCVVVYIKTYDEDVVWICCIIAIIGIVIVGWQAFDIITCYTIPEKMVIEYLQRLYEK